MPRVPSYGGFQATPTVQPAGALEAVNPQIHQGVFNGAQAMMSAAQGLSEVAQKAFDEANQTRVQEALNALDAEVFNDMYGQDGMMNRKGKDVVDVKGEESFTQEGMGKFERSVSRHAESLSPIQRKMYEEKVLSRRLSAEKDFTRHEAQQYNAFSIETESVRAARAADNLAINGYDPVRLNESVQEIKSAYEKIGELQGLGSEKTKYEADKAVSSSISGVIRAQLANGNVEAALKLFELGDKGLIRGSDAVSLRQTLAKAQRLQAIDGMSQEVAYYIETNHDVNYRLADQVMKTDYTSPELEKDLAKATTEKERREAYAKESDRILVKVGGDPKKACQYVLMGDRALEDGVVVSSAEADSMATIVMTAPDAGTEMSDDDIVRQVHKMYPDATVEERIAIAKKTKDIVRDRYIAVDQGRAQKISEIRDSIMKDPGVDVDKYDLDSLSEAQRVNLRMFQENLRNKPNYFPGKASDLRNAYRLQTMGRAELESELLLIDPNEHQSIRRLYEQIQSKTVKPGETDEREVLKVFNAELHTRESNLLESSNKQERERAYIAFRAQVEQATKDNGNVPLTSTQIKAQMAMFKLPKIFKSSANFFVETEKQLDKSSDGRSALKKTAELLGYGTSTMSLINLAQRLESKDPEVFGMLDQVGLPGLRQIVGDKAFDYLIEKHGKAKVSSNTNAALLEVIGALYEGKKLEPTYKKELTTYGDEN